jgi:hypothetical protein
MKKSSFLYLLFPFLVFISCNEDTSITKDKIDGVVQKGPFLNGSSIDIYELTNDYFATGKSYTANILDNTGLFELKNVSLESPYALLKAEGYYFNEVDGRNSMAPLTLTAVTDVTDKSSVNVNVLTHLEKGRIEYLLSTGLSFSDAKKHAEAEVLRIFSIEKPDIPDFNLLDITESGDDNAILLAISIITQGYRSESDLSELLANMISDIREDGELNSAFLGSLLITDVSLVDLAKTRTNIESRYAGLGMTVSVPDFEKYVTMFIDSTDFEVTSTIDYPEYSNYGENILYGDKTSFDSQTSLAANLPKGTSLKIVIRGGLWWFQAMPNGPVNWTINTYDSDNEIQTFKATESGKSCDLMITFEPGEHTIEYYENNAATPTRTKVFSSK